MRLNNFIIIIIIVCKQVVTRLLSSRYQDVLVYCLFPVVVTSLQQVVIDGNRLATSFSNKTNTGCS